MSDFEEGLQLSRLHPSHIVAFLRGLPGRVDDRLASADQSSSATQSATKALHDSLARAIVVLKEGGYAPDRSLKEIAPPPSSAHSLHADIHAASLEFARRVAGVPDTAWTENPELLDRVRSACADAAQSLRRISSVDAEQTSVADDRIADRATLLPEEQHVEAADPKRQAEAILVDAEERRVAAIKHPHTAGERRTSDEATQ